MSDKTILLPASPYGPAIERLSHIFFYTSGYHGLVPQDYAHMADSFCIVDIRLSAHSRFPVWRRNNLERMFNSQIKLPDQYIHLPEWGNVNYREADRHKGIVINDFLGGVLRCAAMLPAGCSFAILLCQCKHYDTCHRAKIIELLLSIGATDETHHREFPDVDSTKRRQVPKIACASGKVNGSGHQRELF